MSNQTLEAALSVLKSEDVFAVARARALLTVYHERWQGKWQDYEILDVEHEFSFPLLNPETEAASRSFDEAGKIDVLARHTPTSRLIVIEHKTTSDSVAPDSDYWDRLRMDTQCSKYFVAAHQMGLGEVGSVLYDAISKPGQRPSQVPFLDDHGFKIVKDAAGNRIMTKDGKKPRETGDSEKQWVVQGRLETPDEFETRLLSVLRAAPDDYFAQREVPRLDSDILEYMEDAWSMGQQILYARAKNLWPRNPDACKQFGTCEMFDLCCGRASVDGVRFRKREKIHSELKFEDGIKEVFIGDGIKVHQLLTNSRAKALRKCARYHKLRYEDGLERVGDEAEALHLGSLVHAGLEAYFNAMKVQLPIAA